MVRISEYQVFYLG